MNEWRTARLGQLFRLDNTKLGPHRTEPTVLSLSKYEGFVRAEEYFDKRIASAKLDAYKVVHKGGWAFSTIHIDEGSIAVNSLDTGVISPMYTTMRWASSDDDPAYLALLLRTPKLLAEYGRRAQGSINRRRSLPFRSFAEIEVSLPSLDEQQRTVDLMASMDAHIAALTEEADRVRAMIPALWARMAADGQNWVETTLGAVVDIQVGYPFKSDMYVEDETGIRLLRGDNIVPGRTRWESAKRWPQEAARTVANYSLNEHDVVIAMDRTWVSAGLKIAVIQREDLPSLLVQRVARLTAKSGLNQGLVPFIVGTPDFERLVKSEQTGTAVPHISGRQIASLPVRFPAAAEAQEDLAELMQAHRAASDALRAEAQALREVRTQLLASLVSGAVVVASDADDRLEEAVS